jgi:hypothetical protein
VQRRNKSLWLKNFMQEAPHLHQLFPPLYFSVFCRITNLSYGTELMGPSIQSELLTGSSNELTTTEDE